MTRSRDVSAVQNNLGVAIPPVAAGKNAVINGGFDIWQRGTSFSFAASSYNQYAADRWAMGVGVNQATTIARQATGDTTNLPNIQYCMRFQRNSGQTGTAAVSTFQSFESANSIPFAGKTVTFSFYARAGANYSAASNILSGILYSGTGTDQSIYSGFTGVATVINSPATLTTTWQRFTFTGTVSATATQLALGFQYTPVGTAGAADYFEITGVQLELGSSATPFSRVGGNIQGELAACQRYYYSALGATCLSAAQSTTVVDTVYPLPVSQRGSGTATSITVTSGAVYKTADGGATSYNTGTWTLPSANQNFAIIRYTHGSGVFTAGTLWEFQATSVGFNAEL